MQNKPKEKTNLAELVEAAAIQLNSGAIDEAEKTLNQYFSDLKPISRQPDNTLVYSFDNPTEHFIAVREAAGSDIKIKRVRNSEAKAWRIAAQIALARDDTEKAIHCLINSGEKNPYSPQYLLDAAMISLSADNPEQAWEFLDESYQMIYREDQFAFYCAAKSILSLRKGDIDTALALFKIAALYAAAWPEEIPAVSLMDIFAQRMENESQIQVPSLNESVEYLKHAAIPVAISSERMADLEKLMKREDVNKDPAYAAELFRSYSFLRSIQEQYG